VIQLLISFPNLVEMMRACGPVRDEDCAPTSLRAILMAHLEPSLAARVGKLDAGQMQTVCEYVLAGVILTTAPAA